jgi:hypothetical protein
MQEHKTTLTLYSSAIIGQAFAKKYHIFASTSMHKVCTACMVAHEEDRWNLFESI